MGARIGFWDESGLTQKPTVRRTWSLKGVTPIISGTGSWKSRSLAGVIACSPEAQKPKLFLRIFPRSVRTKEAIRALKELRQHIKEKLILMWDGLRTHHSKEMKAFLRTQRHWLSPCRFPAYAPELNPVEYLWSCGKNKDFAHLYADTVSDLDVHIRRYKRRIRRRPDLLTGFLKKSGLFKRELT